jgi:hypothetical protein
MKKLALGLLALSLLAGLTGCGSPDADEYYDEYYDDYYDDYSYDDSYYDDYSYDDSSYDYYDDYASDVPQGYRDVYSCNIDHGYCEYVSVSISGSEVSSATSGSSPMYPSESLCDSLGCYYVDWFGAQWYFDF